MPGSNVVVAAASRLRVSDKINKFCLFGGERTTTIGSPTDLGEGNRELRAIWRALSTRRDLAQALARGQGLTDLRDMDGVVMGAPSAQVGGGWLE